MYVAVEHRRLCLNISLFHLLTIFLEIMSTICWLTFTVVLELGHFLVITAILPVQCGMKLNPQGLELQCKINLPSIEAATAVMLYQGYMNPHEGDDILYCPKVPGKRLLFNCTAPKKPFKWTHEQTHCLFEHEDPNLCLTVLLDARYKVQTYNYKCKVLPESEEEFGICSVEEKTDLHPNLPQRTTGSQTIAGGEIAAIVVSTVALIIVTLAVIAFCFLKRKQIGNIITCHKPKPNNADGKEPNKADIPLLRSDLENLQPPQQQSESLRRETQLLEPIGNSPAVTDQMIEHDRSSGNNYVQETGHAAVEGKMKTQNTRNEIFQNRSSSPIVNPEPDNRSDGLGFTESQNDVSIRKEVCPRKADHTWLQKAEAVISSKQFGNNRQEIEKLQKENNDVLDALAIQQKVLIQGAKMRENESKFAESLQNLIDLGERRSVRLEKRLKQVRDEAAENALTDSLLHKGGVTITMDMCPRKVSSSPVNAEENVCMFCPQDLKGSKGAEQTQSGNQTQLCVNYISNQQESQPSTDQHTSRMCPVTDSEHGSDNNSSSDISIKTRTELLIVSDNTPPGYDIRQRQLALTPPLPVFQ